MKKLLKKYRFSGMLVLLFTSVLTLSSCDQDELNIQQNYPFEVILMPVPSELSLGETAEMRLTLIPGGHYAETQYFIRYFQFEGQGILQYYDEQPYLPNDIYGLPQKEFRLYYTSQSEENQSFSIWISDSFGNEKKLDFQFQNVE